MVPSIREEQSTRRGNAIIPTSPIGIFRNASSSNVLRKNTHLFSGGLVSDRHIAHVGPTDGDRLRNRIAAFGKSHRRLARAGPN